MAALLFFILIVLLVIEFRLDRIYKRIDSLCDKFKAAKDK